MAKKQVLIFDTTLRDGEQSAGAGLTTHDKLEVARYLDLLGVDIIESGFAASSPADFEAVRTISEEIQRPTIASLARCNFKDIDSAWDAIKNAQNPRIHVFISSSDVQIWHQLKSNPEEVLDLAISSVQHARQYCEDVEFSPMDATRTDPQYLYALLEAVIKAGASTVNIADTVGYSIPSEFGKLINSVRKNVPSINKATISVHCHDDLGNASANSISAIENGATQIEGCINGLGERAGNAALEEVIMTIETRQQKLGVHTNIDTTKLFRTSRLVSDIFGFPIQANKAIVGANAFRHASGIHQDGILKERTTFEIMSAESIGWPSNSLVLGKLSGRAGLKSRLEELGYRLSKDQLNQTFTEFKLLADRKREVTDAALEALMSSQRDAANTLTMYALDTIQVTCGNHQTPTATITIIDPEGNPHTNTSTGTGPIDAVYKSINSIVNVANELTEFRVEAVTEGIDALGGVTVRIAYEGNTYVGRGSDTDIIIASAKAYLNGLNRLLSATSLKN